MCENFEQLTVLFTGFKIKQSLISVLNLQKSKIFTLIMVPIK